MTTTPPGCRLRWPALFGAGADRCCEPEQDGRWELAVPGRLRGEVSRELVHIEAAVVVEGVLDRGVTVVITRSSVSDPVR
jgi:hypothetical protein